MDKINKGGLAWVATIIKHVGDDTNPWTSKSCNAQNRINIVS